MIGGRWSSCVGARVRRILWPALLVIVGAFGAGAQEGESVWMTHITGSARQGDFTTGEAKQRAKYDAYRRALERRGIAFNAEHILRQSVAAQSAENLRRANDAFLLLFRSRSRGFVTEVRNTLWETRQTPEGPEQQVTLDARVTRPAGVRDDGFVVTITPETPTVRVGDAIRIRFRPSKESYLYVFHITSDGVRLLYPAGSDRDVPVPGGSEVGIPSGAGVPWTAELPEGWEDSEDLVLAIATKSKKADDGEGIVDREGYSNAREAALLEILGWLAALPVSEVTDASVRIEVVAH